jgi:hypothetical protein
MTTFILLLGYLAFLHVCKPIFPPKLNFQGVAEFEIYEEILVTPSTTFLPWDTLHPDSLNYQLTYRVGSPRVLTPSVHCKEKMPKI